MDIPDVFCSDTEATNWMSATVETSNEDIIQHIMNICKRDPRAGKVTTGGIVTVKDSVNNWFYLGLLTVSHSLDLRIKIQYLYGSMLFILIQKVTISRKL